MRIRYNLLIIHMYTCSSFRIFHDFVLYNIHSYLVYSEDHAFAFEGMVSVLSKSITKNKPGAVEYLFLHNFVT